VTPHILAPNTPSLLAAVDEPTPLFPPLSVIPPAAATDGPHHVSLVVERIAAPEVGTCALCWSGPGPLAGRVRQLHARPREVRQLCSRCLVALEMLAAQFGPHVRLAIEAAA
jgi:hypothetical protein